jgi:hypothetical protein
MSRKFAVGALSLAALLGVALLVVGCSGSSTNSSQNPAHQMFNGLGRSESNGLALSADPQHIVIDPDNPATPTDPANGNKRYGESLLMAVAKDAEGIPQANLGITFGAAAGALASAGQPVLTDAAGVARDTLRVFEDDPDSIEVSAGDGTRITTLVVTKLVALPPVANAGPDQIVECTGNMQATVHLDGSASYDPNNDITLYEWAENVPAPTKTTFPSGAKITVNLGLGTHTITLRVTDATGKTSTDEVIIQVVDTLPPRVELEFSPSMLWPPNHKMVNVHATVRVDDCGPVTITLLSVTSNEPDNGLGDGDTVGDIQDAYAGTADFDFALRAERAGGGSGRVYTIVYKVVDEVGLETIATGTVKVPHDQGHN